MVCDPLLKQKNKGKKRLTPLKISQNGFLVVMDLLSKRIKFNKRSGKLVIYLK